MRLCLESTPIVKSVEHLTFARSSTLREKKVDKGGLDSVGNEESTGLWQRLENKSQAIRHKDWEARLEVFNL